ncbi:MarR family winged helix-turn-helix transcriptional regulator [Thermoflavimicrobium daqui]|jgi:DNA-binding MarR family transcriptional regulator|uniref:MarR family transcriptional regulator n=1 Tax=Thermoflavimicrobium daqui TaxID=2137476 RepID=A0A364K938_9BACL|nr:MarR family transcriptional regulator [Thermoflavimicrobium daqui]RAL26809.1 MarR family transcriptional regulator [Thermoflavimicrobium daqui]
MSDRITISLELEKTFSQVFREFKKDLKRILQDDMTGAEDSLLHSLLEKNPQSITGLSQDFHVSVSHITHVVDQLEKKGLVQRRRSPADKRVVEVYLTPTGLQKGESINKKKRKYFQEKFSHLTTEELQTLLQIFNKLK